MCLKNVAEWPSQHSISPRQSTAFYHEFGGPCSYTICPFQPYIQDLFIFDYHPEAKRPWISGWKGEGRCPWQHFQGVENHCEACMSFSSTKPIDKPDMWLQDRYYVLVWSMCQLLFENHRTSLFRSHLWSRQQKKSRIILFWPLIRSQKSMPHY